MLKWWRLFLCYFLFGICYGVVFNLALNKPASQSSVYANCVASRSVDGIDGLSRYGLSCSHTIGFSGREAEPWWEVDLLREYYIKGIAISQSDSAPLNRRLTHKFSIQIYGNGENITDASLCYYQSVHATAATTELFACTETIRGRYVRITVNGSPGAIELLYICEVRVFGSPELLSDFVKMNGTEVAGTPTATRTVQGYGECAMRCFVLPSCRIFSVLNTGTLYQCAIYTTSFLVANSTGNLNIAVFVK